MAKKKSRRWWYIGGAVVLLFVLALIFRPKGEDQIQVKTERVQNRTIVETVQASGRIFPEKEVKISSDVSGAIFRLAVQEGDSVQKGDFLAQIDPEAIESQVARARASVNSSLAQLAQSEASAAQAEAQVEQARDQLKTQKTIHQRNTQLYEEEVISQQEFEQSLLNYENAASNLKSSQAQHRSALKAVEAAKYNVESSRATLRELTTSLERTTIYSPTDGIVSKLSVEEGERVVGTIQMTGTEMMRIANFNSMEVQVEVSENDILRVEVGDSADIEVDAYIGKTFRGVVTEIASSAADIGTQTGSAINTEQVTNFIVKIRILPGSYTPAGFSKNKNPFLPGMTANVDIKTDVAKDVLSVPIGAVTTRELPKNDQGSEEVVQEVVFTVQSDTASLQPVTSGRQDGEYIEIAEGLELNTEVITGPYQAVFKNLKDGSQISVSQQTEKE